MSKTQWTGMISLLAGVAALFLNVALALAGWGSPGTAVYERYELLNRKMAVTLLLMSAGWMGTWGRLQGYGRWGTLAALIGVFMMAIGTAAEFWLYTDLSYGGANLRHTAFAAVSIGSLLLDLGAMITGVALWRGRLWPRWSALLLLLALPVDAVAFFTIDAMFAGATMLALVTGYQLLFNSIQPHNAKMAS